MSCLDYKKMETPQTDTVYLLYEQKTENFTADSNECVPRVRSVCVTWEDAIKQMVVLRKRFFKKFRTSLIRFGDFDERMIGQSSEHDILIVAKTANVPINDRLKPITPHEVVRNLLKDTIPYDILELINQYIAEWMTCTNCLYITTRPYDVPSLCIVCGYMCRRCSNEVKDKYLKSHKAADNKSNKPYLCMLHNDMPIFMYQDQVDDNFFGKKRDYRRRFAWESRECDLGFGRLANTDSQPSWTAEDGPALKKLKFMEKLRI
jgi:hypothetical protein